MKQIQFQIRNFRLDYDGVYKITISDGRSFYAFLTLDVILRMLETEGLSHSDVYELLYSGYPLSFNKVTLLANATEYTDDEARLVPYMTAELSGEMGISEKLKMFEFTIYREQ